MFELYLNGSSTKDIHALNPTLPYAAILWSRIEDSWDDQKQRYLSDLQGGIRDRLVKAQLETVGLLSDLLNVASKHHGLALKKFIQTGDKAHLKGIIEIESITMMMRVIDGLSKLTGQDKTFKIKTEETLTLNANLQVAGTPAIEGALSSEDTSQILAIVANAKRKLNAAKGK